MSAGEIRVAINSDQDIVSARQKGRALATELGFSTGDATLIATAISELARNIVSYARKGEITLKGSPWIEPSRHLGHRFRLRSWDPGHSSGHARWFLDFGKSWTWIAGSATSDGRI